MNPIVRPAVIASMCALASVSLAELSVSPLFSDHMVVQRDRDVLVWGEGDSGETIIVTLGDRSAQGVVASDGSWEVRLDPQPAGGPHQLVIESADGALRFDDVLLGDVWICSGQSNMAWPLERTDRGSEFIATAGHDGLRLFNVDRASDRSPLETLSSSGWQIDDSESRSSFSAVGYHFGRLLHENDGVPIGLIHTAWGGTPAEAWAPMKMIEAKPEVYRARLDSLAEYDVSDEEAARIIAEANEPHAEFCEKAWREDIGVQRGWGDPEFDDSSWPRLSLPGFWGGELLDVDGVVWLRRTIELTQEQAQAPSPVLRLARIDDFDITLINGQEVGRTTFEDVVRRDPTSNGGSIERRYPVPSGLLRAGNNTIAIRLLDTRTSGGVREEDRPFGLDLGGDFIELAGDWRYGVGFDAGDHGGFPRTARYSVPVGRPYRRPAVLYNAMVHPMRRFSIAGAIWYQGESNSGRGDEYRELFPDMIEGWRRAWADAGSGTQRDFPFLFVQLPNYQVRHDEPRESRWAEIREAQRLTLGALPNTGMAITIEIGDPADIHPRNKLPVAERLVTIAACMAEGRTDLACRAGGPTPRDARAHAGRLVVRFNSQGRLKTSDGSREVLGFAIAGRDGVYHWATTARIRDRDTVLVTSDEVSEPRFVRYAWAENPAVNLVDEAGLPATPFMLEIDSRSN
ncbi:MAG: sialate O-acetylesterase [Planctomycetota bacterium]